MLDRFSQIAPKVLIASDGYVYKGQVDRSRGVHSRRAGRPAGVETVLIVPYAGGAQSVEGPFDASSGATRSPRIPMRPCPSRACPSTTPLHHVLLRNDRGPNCILHGAGGVLLQHLKEHRLQCDIRPGDRVLYATSTGWMMWNWLRALWRARRRSSSTTASSPPAKDGALLLDYVREEAATLFGTAAGYLRRSKRPG